MARALKPDGRALCAARVYICMAYRYGIPPESEGLVFSERFGAKKEWQELIEENGLKVEK